MFYFQFYIFTILYIFFGLTLIWEEFDDNIDEMELLNPMANGLDFYSAFGFLVHWETLVDHLESISLDPVVNNDILYLKDFYSSLDNIIDNNVTLINKNSNLMLLDVVISKESLSINNKMIKLNSLDNDNNINDFNKTKLKKFKIKFKKKFIKLDQQILSKNDKLKNNYESSIHNKVLVGSYLNHGLYPISNYDCDRVTLSEDRPFFFFEYSLFNYSYFNNLKWLDSSLIEYKTKI